MARPLLEANVFSQADFERFAQRMAAATTDDDRGQVVTDYLRFASMKMAEAGQRIMAQHAAQHPSNN